MKVRMVLLNKKENKKGMTTFIIATSVRSNVISFVYKITLVKGFPDELEYQHDTDMGYWVEIKTPTHLFEQVLSNLKEIFKNDERYQIIEDLQQKEWALYML